MTQQRTATLTFDDGTPPIDFPVLSGTIGPDVVDIRTLYNKTGKFTYDPGFMSTASCKSAITYIDGDKGVLLYRGYPIEQLAEKCDFLEVCYLLLKGELPTLAQQRDWDANITPPHHGARAAGALLLRVPPRCASDGGHGRCGGRAVRLLSRLARHQQSRAPRDLRRSACWPRCRPSRPCASSTTWASRSCTRATACSYVENFLHMMFGTPCEEYEPNPVLVRALDRILILHADHEQNASTSTVRLAGSSGANPFACIAAGIACLWGPAHGGANEAVLNMLEEIGDVSRIGQFIKRAKDKNDNFRLMGFGHRVYKNYDPRAKLMRETCHEVLGELGLHDDRLFKLAMELERIALEDEYFVEKKLYPNVDFYSGIVQRAMGIPVSMFTAIFALARTVGWIAQWNEMIADPEQKIGRPRQLFVGATKRDVVPIAMRG